MGTIRIPKPSFYFSKLRKRISNWCDNLPSLEQDLARQTCDKLQKQRPEVRRMVFDELMEEWIDSEPKLAKQFEKHRDHLIGGGYARY